MTIFKHPTQVCMTYLEHFQFSMKLAFLQLDGSIKAVIHAFWPDICVTSTNDINRKIRYLLDNAGCKDAKK